MQLTLVGIEVKRKINTIESYLRAIFATSVLVLIKISVLLSTFLAKESEYKSYWSTNSLESTLEREHRHNW